MRRIALGLVLLSACIPVQQRGAGATNGGQSSGGDDGNGNSNGNSNSNSNSNSAPSGPETVSVTIRSACPSTVKVFYGDKPKFGSGTYSSIESNSVESHTFTAGDMMWIVDESENGLASTGVGAGTHEIEIQSGCTSLIAR